MDPAPRRVSFREAFLFWLKLGFISFGGPAGQIAIMHRELVERRRWFAEDRFLHALNYCMVLPGPEAQQLATYLGWLLHGVRGGLVAGGLFILPSVFLLLGLSWVYVAFGQVPVVAGLLHGMKAAVVALVLAAVLRLGRRALVHPLAFVLAAFAFVALVCKAYIFPPVLFPWVFPLILLAAATVSWIAQTWFGVALRSQDGHGGARANYGPPLVELPPQAPPSWRVAARTAIVGLLCWLVPIGLLVSVQGWNGTHFQMGLFFTLTALVTFGGAYAVLPYVGDAAVMQYGWLQPRQMVDGLALGETTPGPLIMVVAFVGFVGGWQTSDGSLASAILGGLTATYFTFLPSFAFIFLGAPYIERTQTMGSLQGILAGITATVVGVIATLAVSFGGEVFFPGAGGIDFFALGLSAAAFGFLAWGKFDMLWVIGGCGAIGCLWRMVANGTVGP